MFYQEIFTSLSLSIPESEGSPSVGGSSLREMSAKMTANQIMHVQTVVKPYFRAVILSTNDNGKVKTIVAMHLECDTPMCDYNFMGGVLLGDAREMAVMGFSKLWVATSEL